MKTTELFSENDYWMLIENSIECSDNNKVNQTGISLSTLIFCSFSLINSLRDIIL